MGGFETIKEIDPSVTDIGDKEYVLASNPRRFILNYLQDSKYYDGEIKKLVEKFLEKDIISNEFRREWLLNEKVYDECPLEQLIRANKK